MPNEGNRQMLRERHGTLGVHACHDNTISRIRGLRPPTCMFSWGMIRWRLQDAARGCAGPPILIQLCSSRLPRSLIMRCEFDEVAPSRAHSGVFVFRPRRCLVVLLYYCGLPSSLEFSPYSDRCQRTFSNVLLKEGTRTKAGCFYLPPRIRTGLPTYSREIGPMPGAQPPPPLRDF